MEFGIGVSILKVAKLNFGSYQSNITPILQHAYLHATILDWAGAKTI